VRPRIGNGARRGLALLAAIGWEAFEDPTHPWKTLRTVERRELARALAWMEWHRTHTLKGVALDLKRRPPKGRAGRISLEHIPIPFGKSQDVERAV
jgi:hypothetical protein